MNKKILIQVLGSGCLTCEKLFTLTKQAVLEMKIDAEVEYVTDLQKLVALGIMSVPAVAINGEPVLTGFVPDIKTLKAALSKKL